MLPETHDIVDGYWADVFGCSPETLRGEGISVVAGETDDVELVRRGDSVVVSVDATRTVTVREALSGVSADDVVDCDTLTERFGSSELVVHEILGPAFLGYADGSTLSPADGSSRLLTKADSHAYDELRAACSGEEWSDGGSSFVAGRSVGRFVDSELVALAGYDIWDDTLAHVAVVTHPDHRNAGHAQAVVGTVARHALDRGLIPQYRTLDAWPWSVRVAEALGFERWGTSLLVRLE